MLSKEIRRRFIDFFVKKHAHAEISSSSLIPENDPTVLFTTAGMHPLVPYLMGEKHAAGKRLVDSQKCLRTDDIDEVGDTTHLTFFEMLGNWSLGDYFKKGAISMSYELLRSPVEKGGFALDPNRIHVSCFAGDTDAPLDEEAAKMWESLGFERVGKTFDPEKDRRKIFFFGKKENWWGPAGQTGPCGPDTEMFYDTRKPSCPTCAEKGPSCSCGRFVEIWNDVFMEFNKKADGTFEPLAQQNVDTGMGLERITAVLQGKESHFETELFMPVIEKIRDLSQKSKMATKPIQNKTTEFISKVAIETVLTSTKKGLRDEEKKVSERIIADHLRAATFVLGDDRGVVPSNTDQGYVVRRLIRRAIRHGKKLGIEKHFIGKLASIIIRDYRDIYEELGRNERRIVSELEKEEELFHTTLSHGEKEFEKILLHLKNKKESEVIPEADKKHLKNDNLVKNKESIIDGLTAFHLYDTYGFPLEMTKDLAKEHGLSVDEKGFEEAFQKHQALSRTGAEQKFAGGLADHSVETTRLHTATHMLHQALRTVLGTHVGQKGSNITKERLRFDFSHPQKMTQDEIARVENIVNEKIQESLPVSFEEMTVDEAKERGALGFFEHKYGAKVKVYTIGNEENGTLFSREICGGPHVKNISELKKFKILKEEGISLGIRRIKAIVDLCV
ncbi:alanine--tRNA ligase [Candidatus Peregrinibacteria bacterium]|nr:alanine--tRNA ligase [Candidatus Peregrinibacteria bacterium]